MSAFLMQVMLIISVMAISVLTYEVKSNSVNTYQFEPNYVYRGQKGSRGLPGICPALCGNSCAFGARGILQVAKEDGGDNISIDSLRAAVEEGNQTAMALESRLLSVDDLSEAEANRVFTYLLFRNGVCDASLLRGPPDVVKGQKGQKGARGSTGARGQKGATGTTGTEGSAGQKGDQGMMGDPGLKGVPGMKGEKGELGLDGNIGVPGPVGPVGASGASGPPGPQGVQGLKGDLGTSGVTYINWGEDACPPQAVVLYVGSAVRTLSPGGPLQCLYDNFRLHTFNVPLLHTNSMRTLVYMDTLHTYLPVRCAMCYAPTRTAKFVSVGTTMCPVNWTKEYEGALATQHHELYSDSVCMNLSLIAQIEWNEGGFGENDFDLVGPECTSGQCLDGQVSCVLCTR